MKGQASVCPFCSKITMIKDRYKAAESRQDPKPKPVKRPPGKDVESIKGRRDMQSDRTGKGGYNTR